jgi:putative nucleotidyltransferase with HDIG domain
VSGALKIDAVPRWSSASRGLGLLVGAGLLIGAAVVVYDRFGVPAVIALALGLWGVRLSAASAWRVWCERDDLRAQVDEFRALHMGVITMMVESMGMRDPVTARHSAAVARLARATAAAAGLSARHQELVHTAGLVHDIGKFTFPDRTLTGAKLTEEDWELIRSHPRRGADLVRRVHGFEAVAELVLCSHERIDGRGYPRGLDGERIPELARILAIAECFHAMTAHDSYRPPLSFRDAITELRRVSGTQLDRRLVEIFVGVVMSAGVDLDLDRREHDAAAPVAAGGLR